MALTIDIQPAANVVDGNTEKMWWDKANAQHILFMPTVVAIMTDMEYHNAWARDERPTDWLTDNNITYGIYRANKTNHVLIFFLNADDAALFKLSL